MQRPAARVCALVLVAWALLNAPAHAQSTPLARELGSLVDDAALGHGIGIHVVSLATGNDIFALRQAERRNPASNMKLVTAAAALLTLGSDFRMDTGLYGSIEEGGLVRELSIRGFGDPDLRMNHLDALADALADRGVRRVQAVIVDGTYFDAQALPPAFEQQPGEMSAFRAAVGAVSVDRSAYALRILPGPEIGAPASIRLLAAGYFDLESTVTTTADGRPNVVAIQRGDGPILGLSLRGTVPIGIRGITYRRRVPNPLAYAGHAMVRALRRAGIRGSLRVRIGATPDGAPLLTEPHHSAPVGRLIWAMGKLSDNFTAEMLLKVMGAEQSRPGSFAGGIEVLQTVLAQAGVPRGEATIVNGSGLFTGNEVAPSHLTRLLRHMYRTPSVRAEYLAHLAIGGADGTLHRRLRDLPAPRIVRAKTGTLNDVISLSGYVLGPTDGYAFSFLANGIRGHQRDARALSDALVRRLAEELYPEPE